MAGGKVSNAAVAAALMALFVVVAVARANGFCNMDQAGLESCKPYCTAGSTEEKPAPACCTAAHGADFACLCRNQDKLRYMGNIDANRVKQIPSKCNIKPLPTCASY